MSKDNLNLLGELDYSVLQQCMHCGMCLPSCPTYTETLQEKSSPRGRIAMMRSIVDGHTEVSKNFAEEMYFCLGCLACQTACPAGVDYATLFENSRGEIERKNVLQSSKRDFIRYWTLGWLFMSLPRLRRLGKLLRFYQRSGLEKFVRKSKLIRLLPKTLRDLEPLTPRISSYYTSEYIERLGQSRSLPQYRVGLISGCIQDISFAETNADTIEVLRTNGCEVILPSDQSCCGSLHAHNGELGLARDLARKNIDSFMPESLDAVIVNSGGCGSHLAHYDRLLQNDSKYAERAKVWSQKIWDIHEYLLEIGFRSPKASCGFRSVTYHESCHLKHGQGVSDAPRALLKAIPDLDLVELHESDWCCGSAGIYNITQPEMSMKLLDRKMGNIKKTGVEVIATGNPGCAVQIQFGGRRGGESFTVLHPVQLLAAAYRAEVESQ